MSTLESAIRHAINSESAENASNTPDWILSQYLLACLDAFNAGVQAREKWYGMECAPGGVRNASPVGGIEEDTLIHEHEERCQSTLIPMEGRMADDNWVPERPPVSYAKTVGENVRRLRESRGLSAPDLATRTGLTRSYLWKLERGGFANPGVATLDRIAQALDVWLTDLTEWTPGATP